MDQYLRATFFGLKDRKKFDPGIQMAVDALTSTVGAFAGDNLRAFKRNLPFLSDEKSDGPGTAGDVTPDLDRLFTAPSTGGGL